MGMIIRVSPGLRIGQYPLAPAAKGRLGYLGSGLKIGL